MKFFIITCFAFLLHLPVQAMILDADKKTVSDSKADTSILYIFIGSDWCSNCKRLEKNVLQDTSFITAMATNGVRLELIDFPQRKKLSPATSQYNKALAEKFQFTGTFPTLVICNSHSNKYQTFSYGNENARSFTTIILNELKKTHE